MTIDRLFHDLSDIIKHRSSSLRCFIVPSVRAYAYSVSAVVRFAISLLYSSWVISPFARSSHLMRTIRGFLEGFPCSGKSTTARYIAEQTGGAFFDEDCADHPADYTFHAFIPDGSEGFTAEETALLRENGAPQPGGIVVPLSRLSGELFNKALKFKIYDFLDWQTERPVMLRKWQEFAERAGDGVNVFNCVLLQNPMCETMMRFGMPQEQSFEFIRDICSAIAPLEPVVIYLKSSDPAALVRSALPERGNDWLNAVVDYHCSGEYGRSRGLSGFEGYIAALEERQRRELEMLPQLPVKSFLLDDPQRDWNAAYSKIGELLRGKDEH